MLKAANLPQEFHLAAGWLSKFPELPTILISPHNLIIEAHSIQDLKVLSDVKLVSAFPPMPPTAASTTPMLQTAASTTPTPQMVASTTPKLQTAASTTPTPQTAERKSLFPVNRLRLLADNLTPDGELPDPDPDLDSKAPPALSPIDDVLNAAYQTDPLAIEILQALYDGMRTNK